MQRKRQPLIEGWNQKAFTDLRVLVAGAGALGSQAVIGAARLGVGTITVADFDVLEEHNLENQVYDATDLGKPKAVALKERVRRIDPSIKVIPYLGRIQDYAGNLDGAILLGCLDHVAGRYWLNHLSVTQGIPYIDGGILRFLGTIPTILPGKTACYSRELFSVHEL